MLETRCFVPARQDQAKARVPGPTGGGGGGVDKAQAPGHNQDPMVKDYSLVEYWQSGEMENQTD